MKFIWNVQLSCLENQFIWRMALGIFLFTLHFQRTRTKITLGLVLKELLKTFYGSCSFQESILLSLKRIVSDMLAWLLSEIMVLRETYFSRQQKCLVRSTTNITMCQCCMMNIKQHRGGVHTMRANMDSSWQLLMQISFC
eukprot:SAG11_NODE_7_length_31267_cov_19.541966_9_plen_140_part_00